MKIYDDEGWDLQDLIIRQITFSSDFEINKSTPSKYTYKFEKCTALTFLLWTMAIPMSYLENLHSSKLGGG